MIAYRINTFERYESYTLPLVGKYHFTKKKHQKKCSDQSRDINKERIFFMPDDGQQTCNEGCYSS